MTNSCDNVGFWDSVLIENLTEETFTSNIYQRYRRGLIYVSIFMVLFSFEHVIMSLFALRHTLVPFWWPSIHTDQSPTIQQKRYAHTRVRVTLNYLHICKATYIMSALFAEYVSIDHFFLCSIAATVSQIKRIAIYSIKMKINAFAFLAKKDPARRKAHESFYIFSHVSKRKVSTMNIAVVLHWCDARVLCLIRSATMKFISTAIHSNERVHWNVIVVVMYVWLKSIESWFSYWFYFNCFSSFLQNRKFRSMCRQ